MKPLGGTAALGRIVRPMVSARFAFMAIAGFLILVIVTCLHYTPDASRIPIFDITGTEKTAASSHSSLPYIKSQSYVEVVVPEGDLTWAYRVFKSSPYRPPNLKITRDVNGPPLADGYLFVTAKSRAENGLIQSGALIMTSRNEPVFMLPGSENTNDFRVQQIGGKSFITYWRGASASGYGFGELGILDEEYGLRVLNTLRDVRTHGVPVGMERHINGVMDFHEHQITDHGTILVTSYNITDLDLYHLGGLPDGKVVDSLIYEIDIFSGKVVFSWSAFEHFNYESSKMPLKSYQANAYFGEPYDAFHINSIQDLGPLGLLISCRHLWSVFLISREDGHIVWKLAGEGPDGDFGPLPAEGQFRWQHQARAIGITNETMDISLFDNHNTEDDTNITTSRSLVLRVDLPPSREKPPAVISSIPSGFFVQGQGSYDAQLSNGNQLVGHGPIPVIQEFSSSDHGNALIWEGRFGYDNKAQSYRVYKSPWHGTPHFENPSLFAERKMSGFLVLHVSWNGATDIDAWKVLRGKDEASLVEVALAKKQGFETFFELRKEGGGCVQVAAMRRSADIRRSNIVCVPDAT